MCNVLEEYYVYSILCVVWSCLTLIGVIVNSVFLGIFNDAMGQCSAVWEWLLVDTIYISIVAVVMMFVGIYRLWNGAEVVFGKTKHIGIPISTAALLLIIVASWMINTITPACLNIFTSEFKHLWAAFIVSFVNTLIPIVGSLSVLIYCSRLEA